MPGPATVSRAVFLALLLAPLCVGAAPRATGAPEEPQGKALDEHFSGKVVSIERRGLVTLRYDFEDPAQLGDWYEAVPFPVKRQSEQGVSVTDGGMVIKGSTAARHNAAWAKDIQVTARLKLDTTRNLGGILTPDNEENDFAAFAIREFFFHAWDTGQKGGQHSIIKFGDQWRETGPEGDFIGFRYVIRKPPEERIIEGRTIDFAFGLKRGKLLMEVKKQEFKGKDFGVKLKVFHPGFYAVKGNVRIDDVVIVGTLDPEWLEANDLALRIASPPSDEE